MLHLPAAQHPPCSYSLNTIERLLPVVLRRLKTRFLPVVTYLSTHVAVIVTFIARLFLASLPVLPATDSRKAGERR